MDTKQITVTLTEGWIPVQQAEIQIHKSYIVAGEFGIDIAFATLEAGLHCKPVFFAHGGKLNVTHVNTAIVPSDDELRSALKAEQKPEEAKTVTLGPDTPYGYYRIIRFQTDGLEWSRSGEPMRLVSRAGKCNFWKYPDGSDFSTADGATLLPVAPPVPAPVAEESLQSQIDRLAKFIVGENLGYPNANEGAIDTAIRIIGEHSRGEKYKAGYEVGFSEGRSDLQRKIEKAMEAK